MAVKKVVIGGVVRNGLVVPDHDEPLPEGARIEIILPLSEAPPALLAEIEVWERASDEAWAMIDQWDQDSRGSAGPSPHES